MIVILMGVSGVGKTTIGSLLAKRLDWEFVEGDELHPPESIVKMSAGVPLTDEDRLPWLRRVRESIEAHEANARSAVVTCSALKQSYRDHLVEGTRHTRFVFLDSEPTVIEGRLAARGGHFFEPTLLASQFESLEVPTDVPRIDVSGDVETALDDVLEALALRDD